MPGDPEWGNARLVETLRIGALDGPPEHVFGQIVALAVTEDGTLWVADGQGPVVRRYDADGRYLGDVGREGSGPGEYRFIAGLKRYPRGRLALYDPRNTRVNIYDTAGVYEKSLSVQAGLYERDIFATDADGTILVKARSRRERGNRAQWEKVWIRISPEGTVLDSLEIPLEPTAGFSIATPSGFREPFPTGIVSGWSPLGYLVVGDNETYLLQLISPTRTERSLRRDYRPVTVGRAERQMWERWARFMSRRGPLVGFDGVPDRKPAFRSIMVDDDGRIWIDRYAPAQRRRPSVDRKTDAPEFDWREAPTWDVLSPDGRFLAQLIFPEDAAPWVASGNHVWSVVRGELDEQHVVRFRIERTPEP